MIKVKQKENETRKDYLVRVAIKMLDEKKTAQIYSRKVRK